MMAPLTPDVSKHPSVTFGSKLYAMRSAGDIADDLARICQIIEDGEHFEVDYYRAARAPCICPNPAAHYLQEGWQIGHEPNSVFEGAFLYPYFKSVGFDDAPLLTYLTLRSAGWAVYSTRLEVEQVALRIERSGLFDRSHYLAQLSSPNLDPLFHYILVGERAGYAPSSGFDPAYYEERYPDIVTACTSYLTHYITHGANEGRRPVSIASELSYDRSRIDPNRETILLVSHQATRTGAPILAYNIATHLNRRFNIVVLLLAGGDLVHVYDPCSSAVVGPLKREDWHPVEAKHLTNHILKSYNISYALLNSIDARLVAKPLALNNIPIIMLVHEFPSYLGTKGEMGRALEWSTNTVFSSKTVLTAVRAEYPAIDNWSVHILPQGQVLLPPSDDRVQKEKTNRVLRAAMRPSGDDDTIVVLGCGTIYNRKGVDLFISCAAELCTFELERPVRFVWVGSRVDTEAGAEYFDGLLEQIERFGLGSTIVLVDEVDNLDLAYSLADIFLLSSRLDPMPNVAIDAAILGRPVVCFEGAGGIPEILSRQPETRKCVVPHLDVRAAAKIIAELCKNDALRSMTGEATQQLAQQTFNMERYVKRLEQLGHDSSAVMKQRIVDFKTISEDQTFDSASFLGFDNLEQTRDEAIRLFLARAAAMGTSQTPTANFYYRRPCPGFHPQLFAHDNRFQYDISLINPLAEFIRRGKPIGPWLHEVITPNIQSTGQLAAELKTALHVHFHYPELVPDFVGKIMSNTARCDLLISTNTPEKACAIRRGFSRYASGNVKLKVVPNRGRDIGPFLTAFREAFMEYDVIGHVHSKRSLFTDAMLGETWREFLWQNLLGGFYPMMDIILSRLQADVNLGLVFPDDPHLPDWDNNREIAEALAARMMIGGPLPAFFDFPVGTMFWARTAALRPLLDLNLGWHDYPGEPVPIDGTILHALERLLPFVVRHTGYRYATTHVPGVTW